MLRLPLDRLPEAAHARHGALRDYFCDKDAIAIRRGDAWECALEWPDGLDRHVDPQLDAGLAWWGGNIKHREMVFARRRTGRLLTCLYDTWTLHSWSEWLMRAGGIPPRITILHIDDHRDLASPRLFATDAGMRDAITQKDVDLLAPVSIHDGITSGAIGMGSFMTPFLYTVPHVEVRHLCQPPKVRGTQDYRIARTTAPDTLIEPGRERIAIELSPKKSVATGPGCYRLTSDEGAWLSEISNGPVLLHIDMDFFNNRYDGDTDWQTRVDRLDPSGDDCNAKIDQVVHALRTSGIGNRIEDIVLCYPPGFFPAEMWAHADARLRPQLNQLL